MATAPVAQEGQAAPAQVRLDRAGAGKERPSGRRPDRRRPRAERPEDTDDALELAPSRGRLDVVA